MFTRPLSLPSTQARTPHSWARPQGLGNQAARSQRAPHPTPHSRAGPAGAADHLHSQGRLQAGSSGPGARAAKGTRDLGQKQLWAAWVRCQMGWPQAQEQVTGQRSRVKATKSCMMYALSLRRAWHLGQHTKPDLCGAGPGFHPSGTTRTPGAAQMGRGRGQRVIPRKLVAHDPAQGCVLWAQSPLSCSSGPAPVRRREGQKAPQTRAGLSSGLRRSYRHTVHRGCGSPGVWRGPRPSPRGGLSGAFQGRPAASQEART